MLYRIINGAITLGNNTILENINFEVKNQEHIAIVGQNGTGKTTLLRAIIGEIEFEQGLEEQNLFVTDFPIDKIGYINQNAIMDEEITMLDEILKAYQEVINLEQKLKKIENKLSTKYDEKLSNKYQDLYLYYKNIGGYNYKKEYETAIKMFGFSEEDKQKKIKEFSYGQRTKIAFLKILLNKPDLLLLDEPTNHLDIKAIEWLEDYLKNYKKMLVIVSHDRMFLDTTCNITYEIEYGSLTKYSGNYSYYEKQKKLNYERSLQDFTIQQKEIARLKQIADRFRYKPTKASMAMSKLKQIEKMTKLSNPKQSNHQSFSKKFNPKEESYRDVLKVKNLKIGYEKVIGELNFNLERGERLGIIGENGTGKSTFVKTIMSKIPKLGGKFVWGNRVAYAYFDQNVESLAPDKTVLEIMEKEFPTISTEEIRGMLGTFGFTGDMVFLKVASLSGGQKVKLLLCSIIYHQPNVLILDEPTNHLDIFTKQEMEELLLQYQGTIIFVTHDRYFVKKIATSLLIFENKEIIYHQGSYSDYLEKRTTTKISDPKQEINSKISSPKVQYQNTFKEKSKLERKIQKLEIEIQKIEEMITNCQNEMLQEEVYLNINKIRTKETELKELEDKLSLKMLEWEAAITLLEQ